MTTQVLKNLAPQARTSTEGEPQAGDWSAWLAALQSPQYRQVEQRVIRQLIQTLIFEDILPSTYQTSRDAGMFVLEGKTASNESVYFQAQGRLAYSFAMVKLDESPVQRVAADGSQRPAQLEDITSELLGQISGSGLVAQFNEELEQTLLKDLQAQSQSRPAKLSPAQRQYDELEGNLMDAHYYHPCYKSRIGFTLADNSLYGPEFKQPVKLHWLAITKADGLMNATKHLDYKDFIQRELGDSDYQRFTNVLQDLGKSIEDHWLVPVHPWQWRLVSARFHRELARQDIVWLGQGSDSYRPQQSIRSLANQSAPEKCYLKLSLSITNTSSSRILAGHTVLNGPVVTDWLKALVAADDYARQLDFIILGEVLGASFNYLQLPEARRASAYGVMGAIWRESLHPWLRPGEGAVPCNGLCHLERDGTPLIDCWIDRHGLKEWTRQFLTVTIEPIIHMLFAEGVAMESHAQNIVLLHADGWPTRIALKDFHDGVRFSPAQLAHPELNPALVPVPESHARINRNSFIITDDLDAVRDFTCDAFFFICLGEQAVFLQRHYQLPEADFWAMAADIITAYQQANPQHARRYAAFDVFAPSFQVEELTKRRLLGDSEPRFRHVPNPLHDFRPSLS